MATKSTTIRTVVRGGHQTDRNNMVQLPRKSAIVGSSEALRRAALLVVSTILSVSVSVTIATQLKL